VALPQALVSEVTSVAPPNLKGNLNRLVTVALQEFAERRRAQAFEKAMQAMAADPAIRSQNAAIGREFSAADFDGLDG
jgi:hypothetical protein